MESKPIENTQHATLFIDVGKTVEVIGVTRLLEFLRIIRQKPSEITPENELAVTRIISITCNVLGITTEDLYSGSRKNDRRFAIGICAHLIEREVGLDSLDISYLLKKPNDIICRYKKDIVQLNPKHIEDTKKLEKLSQIIKKINQAKNATT